MKSYEIERLLKSGAKTEGRADGLLMLLQETREVSAEEREHIESKIKADTILTPVEDLGPMPEEAKERILS